MAKTLFVGTKRGFFTLQSVNPQSWRVANRSLEGDEVADLLFQPEQNRLWAATHGKGLFLSNDRGISWQSIRAPGDG